MTAAIIAFGSAERQGCFQNPVRAILFAPGAALRPGIPDSFSHHVLVLLAPRVHEVRRHTRETKPREPLRKMRRPALRALRLSLPRPRRRGRAAAHDLALARD